MRALVSAAVLVAALAGAAQAAPIAYDGIAYPAGLLNGRGPVFGFAGRWVADPGVLVTPAGLSSSLDLPSSGGAVSGNFNFQAPLSNLLTPLPGTDFWASFLLFHSGPNDQTYMGLSGAGATFGDPPAAGFGVRLGQYGIFIGGAFFPCAKPFTGVGSTDFLMTHFTAGGGSWIVDLYVNPSALAVPDLTMNVPPVIFGTMVNQNQSEFGSDEFRLGTLPSDVSAFGVTPTARSTWGRVKRLYR